MKLSLVIPSFGDYLRLLPCIESVRTQKISAPHTLEVLIASHKLISLPAISNLTVKVVLASGTGVNHARNAGLSQATGDLVYFLDDDCRLPHSFYLQHLLERFEQNPSLQAAGGGYLCAHNESLATKFYNMQCNWWMQIHRRGSQANALLGGAMVFRSEVFQAGERFLDQINYGGAETELLQRLKKKNMLSLVFDKNLSVVHAPSIRAHQLAIKAWRQGWSRASQDAQAESLWNSLRSLISKATTCPSFLLKSLVVAPYAAVGVLASLTFVLKNYNPRPVQYLARVFSA